MLMLISLDLNVQDARRHCYLFHLRPLHYLSINRVNREPLWCSLTQRMLKGHSMTICLKCLLIAFLNLPKYLTLSPFTLLTLTTYNLNTNLKDSSAPTMRLPCKTQLHLIKQYSLSTTALMTISCLKRQRNPMTLLIGNAHSGLITLIDLMPLIRKYHQVDIQQSDLHQLNLNLKMQLLQ